MKIGRQFMRFSIIGAAGFVVDVGVLYLMIGQGLDLYSARVVSFVCAATSTWLGNRYFTFASGRRRQSGLHGEWAAYIAAMIVGGLVNYGVYALLVTHLALFHQQPWLAVAAGTGAGMMINFALARRILYREPG